MRQRERQPTWTTENQQKETQAPQEKTIRRKKRTGRRRGLAKTADEVWGSSTKLGKEIYVYYFTLFKDLLLQQNISITSEASSRGLSWSIGQER
jgi:hypothetical protein